MKSLSLFVLLACGCLAADGSSFPLKFTPTAGFTYNMSATLRGNASAAAHIRLSVYPPESISTTDDAGNVDSLGCDLPPKFSEPAHDVGEIKIGSFAGPASGRQSWGAAKCATGNAPGCCEDPTRVGPPEAPCDGNYRHFPGQDFGPGGSWTWTAPMTGEYILLVTANCDVPLYSDPNQPGCTETADGLDCVDEAVETCAAGIDLTITSTDKSVHLIHTFEVPILAGLTGRRALQRVGSTADTTGESDHALSYGRPAQLAALSNIFRKDQLSGLAFPTAIIPFDCDVPEHQSRDICVAHRGNGDGGGDGGHRRRLRRLRRLQGSCPHADFVRREVEMLHACGLTSDATADAAVLESVACPSLACAEAMTSLLDDCAESIEHLGEDCTTLVDASCEQNRVAANYYRQLERSAVFAGCEETEQNHAQFVEVEVQFRAPSLAAANQMVRTHEAMVAVLSQPGGCGSDGGRRGLTGDDDQSGESCQAELVEARSAAAKDAAAMQADTARAEAAEAATAAAEVATATAIARAEAAEAATAAAEVATATAIAHAEAAEAVLASMMKQLSTQPDAPRLPTRAIRRREQDAVPVPTLEAITDSTSGQVVACVMSPCTIQGVCLNDGTCEEAVADRGEAVNSFRCNCTPDYYGPRCTTEYECVAEPCQNGGACLDARTDASIAAGSYYCSCDGASGWEGVNCEGNIDECESGPCQNGGTCADGVNGYSCECASGRICGGNCEDTDCDVCLARGHVCAKAGSTWSAGSVCVDAVCVCAATAGGLHIDCGSHGTCTGDNVCSLAACWSMLLETEFGVPLNGNR